VVLRRAHAQKASAAPDPRNARAMNTVPVNATISRAYGFLLGEIVTIGRLTWAPLLLGSGLSYFYGAPAIDGAGKIEANPALFLISLVMFVTGTMAMVALLRVVVFGDRMPGLYIYLRIGAAEARLMLVSVLLTIGFIAAMLGATLVLALVGAMAAAVPVVGVVLLLAAIVAVFGALIWVLVRLSLTWPAIVAENNLGVERSWALTEGNAVSMFLVLLATYGVCTIVTWFVFAAILGSDYPALPAFPNISDADAKSPEAIKVIAETFQKALEKWQVDLTRAISEHWLAISVLTLLSNFISTVLWAGATGAAYVGLTEERRG
jgi:hypothetical protein